MNKVLAIGRLTRDPDTNITDSGIKYTRFSIAVDRQFADNQIDFIPIVAWRNQADFIGKYIKKGALVSVEGRFTSSTYQNSENKNITRYEITADRVTALETKVQIENRIGRIQETNFGENKVQAVQFEKEIIKEEKKDEVPWELDL